LPKTVQRKKPAVTPDRQLISTTLRDIAASSGYTLSTIGDTAAACDYRTDGDGVQQLRFAVIEIPGRSEWSSQAYGVVSRAREDGSAWSVSDTGGWLEAQFPTAEAAVAALRDPKQLKQMRQYTDAVAVMLEAQRRVREFPQPEGALPSYWQSS